MALPTELNTRTVLFKAYKADGTPETGKIDFQLEKPLQRTTGTHVVTPFKVTGTLDSDGAAGVTLALSSDDEYAPATRYKVDIALSGWKETRYIVLDETTPTTIDLLALLPADAPTAGVSYLTPALGDLRYVRTVNGVGPDGSGNVAATATLPDGSVTNAKVATNAAVSLDKTADSATRLALTSAERGKLSGVATGATANSPDATLLARANHTGTQAQSTITNLVSDLAGKETPAGAQAKADGAQAAAEATAATALSASETAASATYARVAAVTPEMFGAVGDGVADDTAAVQAAFDAAGGTHRRVDLSGGPYLVSSTVSIENSNVHIHGAGMGAPTLIGASTLTGNTPVVTLGKAQTATGLALTANAAVGDLTVTLSTVSAATFSAGDSVLLKSNKQIDSEDSAKFAGEIHYVTAVNTDTGVITLNDQVLDSYTTADSAQMVSIDMLSNVTLSNMAVTTQAASSGLTVGIIHARFIDGLTLSNVELHDAYVGIQVRSCLNSRVTGCYVHDISDVTPAGQNLRYGVWVASATQNLSIDGCRFHNTRHAVTTGGSSGLNNNGVQRNITVTNCVSSAADTAHFDTHEPAEGVSFIGCTSIGGLPFTADGPVYGIQMRCRNGVISGCTILQPRGRGIMLFGVNRGRHVVTGNTISRSKARTGGTVEGYGIYFDTSGVSQVLISNNVITDCDGRAISGSGANNDVSLLGNLIDNCPALISGVSVYMAGAARAQLIGNRITGNTFNRPLQMSGSSDSWQITDNYFFGNSNNQPSMVGTANSFFNNYGVNPRVHSSLSASSGSKSFSRTAASSYSLTMTGNVTATLAAPLMVGEDLTIILTQDATGGRTVAWPANVKWSAGTAPALSGAGKTDVFKFIWDGTSWLASVEAQNL